jgi:hypothetical protein
VLLLPTSTPVSPRQKGESPISSPRVVQQNQGLRSTSSSRTRPMVAPKSPIRPSRSQLQIVTTNSDLLGGKTIAAKKRRRRHQLSIVNQLASLKHWLMESTKRSKSPHNNRNDDGSPASNATAKAGMTEGSRIPTPQQFQRTPSQNSRDLSYFPPRLASTSKRTSLSPSPLTPHSNGYRRGSAGLRGRKSTSSSLSSIRSIHRPYSHSKASSISSAASIHAPSVASSSIKAARSPRGSVKVLPATPTTSGFPSNIRIVRSRDFNSENGLSVSPHSPHQPQSVGLVFARRKKSPFKGPMLNITPGSPAVMGGSKNVRRDSSLGRSLSAAARRSGEGIQPDIQEEDEDVEEVDGFSPVSGNEDGDDRFSFKGGEIETLRH